jgi:hypothetical protein
MIPKSGNRFSDKTMLNKKLDHDPDSTSLDHGLARGFGRRLSGRRMFPEK